MSPITRHLINRRRAWRIEMAARLFNLGLADSFAAGLKRVAIDRIRCQPYYEGRA